MNKICKKKMVTKISNKDNDEKKVARTVRRSNAMTKKRE